MKNLHSRPSALLTGISLWSAWTTSTGATKATVDPSSGKHALRFSFLNWGFVKYLRNISQDCAGESQSPIDVEWPEDTLANAQPSQLNFEGYERVTRFILHKLKKPHPPYYESKVVMNIVCFHFSSVQRLKMILLSSLEKTRGFQVGALLPSTLS